MVPTRLRIAAGRREFVQSTRTGEKAVAKLIAAALLSRWRVKLLLLEGRTLDSEKAALIVGGALGLLAIGGYINLDSASAFGLSRYEVL